jgi:hypothetical protein
MSEESLPIVAVFNQEPALVQLLTEALDADGVATIGRVVSTPSPAASAGVLGLLSYHGVSVVVYDIGPPYGEHGRLVHDLIVATEADSYHWVLTSPDVAALRAHVPDLADVPILGKPYDLDHVRAAVKRALAQP